MSASCRGRPARSASRWTLSASDQASPGLEEATRTASGVLDTTGLAPGRHMVYVQGINEDDKPGSVSAAFLNVKAAPEGHAENSR